MPAPDAHDAGPEREQDMPVCRHLRTKMYYVVGRDHADLRHASPSAQYWCARTATALGPDDVYCSPSNCQAHRGCFERE